MKPQAREALRLRGGDQQRAVVHSHSGSGTAGLGGNMRRTYAG